MQAPKKKMRTGIQVIIREMKELLTIPGISPMDAAKPADDGIEYRVESGRQRRVRVLHPSRNCKGCKGDGGTIAVQAKPSRERMAATAPPPSRVVMVPTAQLRLIPMRR